MCVCARVRMGVRVCVCVCVRACLQPVHIVDMLALSVYLSVLRRRLVGVDRIVCLQKPSFVRDDATDKEGP